jgi:hypothetical protein
MRIEWVRAVSCMVLLFVFALILQWLHPGALSWWAGALLAVPTGLFVWVAPMVFWNLVYRRMGWEIPADDDDDSD